MATENRSDIWNNHYFSIRHGESEANVQGIVVSHPDNGVPRYGLTLNGREQCSEAAEKVKSLVTDLGKSMEDVVIVSSDFKRTMETAQMLKDCLGIKLDIRQEKGLRERYFGDFELSSASNYWVAQQSDSIDPTKPNNSVESVFSVYDRAQKAVQSLEVAFSGRVVLLVTHGDPFQIMSCFFLGYKPEEHVSLAYPPNACIRQLSNSAGGLVRRIRACTKNHYYAIRHGQSESNVKRILVCDLEHGGKAYGLTDLGKEQSKEAALTLSEYVSKDCPSTNLEDVIIVTSPLLRAYETASIIHQHLKCKESLCTDESLIERHFGEFNLTSFSDIKVYLSGDLKDIHACEKGIEPLYQVAERLVRSVEYMDATNRGKVFALVTHSSLMLVLRRIFSFQPINQPPSKGEMPNCAIIPFQVLNGS